MGLQLPGELVSLLSILGYDWPTSDEEKLFEMGQAWIDFQATLTGSANAAAAAAQGVWTASSGDAVDAFRAWWEHEENAPAALRDGATGAVVAGVGLIVCAATVLALKVQIIVQLVILAFEIAQAIATAVATCGASLAEIPIFKMITSLILDQVIDQVMNVMLGG